MDHESNLPEELIKSKIHFLRDTKVIFDFDLAKLYNVETKALKQAVKRNINRFPSDFMFVLTREEFEILRSQFVTSKSGGTRYLPMAFTEHGVVMLSSVLKSQRAVDINIQVVRIFTKMRKLMMSHQALLNRVSSIEKSLDEHSSDIKLIFAYLEKLMLEKEENRKQKERPMIGF